MCGLPGIMYHFSDQTGPTALMGGTKSAARISIEELVEPQVVFPMRVEVQPVVAVVDSSPAVVASSEHML